MAPAKRLSCVLWPFLLTLASVILLALVFTGNTTLPGPVPHTMYFLRVNTTTFTLPGANAAAVDAWYTIGLWNYCSGPSNSSLPTTCSPRRPFYYFNPVAAWDIPSTAPVPSDWPAALATYARASHWMWVAYLVAIIAAVATLTLSLFACCGRAGSVFTGIAGTVCAVFTVGASVTMTVLYLQLRGFVGEKLGRFGVSAEVGVKMFAISWAAAACAVVAALVWVLSICFGAPGARRARAGGDGRRGLALPSGGDSYERVPSPGRGGQWYGQDAGKDRIQLQDRGLGGEYEGGAYGGDGSGRFEAYRERGTR